MKNMTSNLALIVQQLLFCNTCASKPKFEVRIHESYNLETNLDSNFRSNIQRITVIIHELFHFWKRPQHGSWTFSENNLTPSQLMNFF